MMEGDPWYPTVEDYLDCPPVGWEWVEVDECCPPPPDIHRCDPKCNPPACPPWEAAKLTYDKEEEMRWSGGGGGGGGGEEEEDHHFDGIDMR